MVDITKAFEIPEDGFLTSDAAGNIIWIGGVREAPNHDAPLGSFAFRDNGVVYKKVTAGSGADKWKDAFLSNAVASPGFGFGRGGNSPTGSDLYRVGQVPSNVVGYPIRLSNALLTSISADNETSTSYSVEIYYHDGKDVGHTTLDTLVVSGATGGDKTTEISVPTGKQVGAKISAGSARNISVTAYIKGQAL